MSNKTGKEVSKKMTCEYTSCLTHHLAMLKCLHDPAVYDNCDLT